MEGGGQGREVGWRGEQKGEGRRGGRGKGNIRKKKMLIQQESVQIHCMLINRVER